MTTTEQTTGGITQLTPQDAEFVYNDGDRLNSNSTGVHFFDATGESHPITSGEALEWMNERLGLSNIFTRRLQRVPFELDYPYWVPDESFDVARHVHVEPVDGPGWDALRRHISRITARRIDLGRPPWEIHFLTGVSGIDDLPARMTVAVWRSHHAAGDGLSSRDLCARLFGPETAPAPTAPRRAAPSGIALFRRAATSFPEKWRAFRRGLTTTGEAAERVAALVAAGELVEPPATRPATRFNAGITSDLTFDVVTFDANRIRTVQAALENTTFNDILLATISGAVATYLAEHEETPDDSLAAMVPMSLRGTRKGVTTPQGQRANHLALMTVDLHTDIADPVARVRAIQHSARLEKDRHRNPEVQAAASRVETSPAWLLNLVGQVLVRRKIRGPRTQRYNLMVSNIPWTGDSGELRGAPAVWSFGLLGIVDGDGLRHLIISRSDDEIQLSFCTDPAMMPDVDRYRDLLVASFDELCGEAVAYRDRSKSHPREKNPKPTK